VTGIVVGYSFTLFLAALTIQHQAILRREMRFTALALIQICATIVGITVGIALALHGYGYWALVWKDLTTGVVMAIGTWIAYPWFPSRPVRGSGVASMLRFGRDVTVFNIVFFVSRSLDQIVLGKFWGAAIAGIYRQAYQLITMLITQIQFPFSHVSVSTLSQLQGNPERYRRCYAKYLSVLLFISMPVAVYFAIFSENIVNILLGAQWIQAGPVVRALAIGAFIHPVAESIGLVLFTLGQTNRYCRWGIMNAIFRVAAIVIGLQWGLLGIAIASAGASYLIAITSLVFSLRGTPISGMSVVKEMYSPMLGSLAMGMILILSARNSEWISSPAGTPISLCLAAVTYCLIWYFFPDGKQRLAEYLSYPYEAVRAFSMSRR
jgi:PST family polysaccharide transporter